MQLWFAFLHVWFPMQKLCFNSKDQQLKYGTKGYSDIGNSNQSEFDLKRIGEYCEHLSTDEVMSIV